MAAFGKVSMVCHNCHVSTMPRVQQKYHWGDFYAIKVKDPLSNFNSDIRMVIFYEAAR